MFKGRANTLSKKVLAILYVALVGINMYIYLYYLFSLQFFYPTKKNFPTVFFDVLPYHDERNTLVVFKVFKSEEDLLSSIESYTDISIQSIIHIHQRKVVFFLSPTTNILNYLRYSPNPLRNMWRCYIPNN